MKTFTVLFFLIISIELSAQSTVDFEVTEFKYNDVSSSLPEPVKIHAAFKKESEMYALGTANGVEIGVQFELVREGTGRNKYWVIQVEFFSKKKGRWLEMCNTRRFRVDGVYRLTTLFECKFDDKANSFSIAYKIEAKP
jgi:hypothetical protein